MFLVEGALEKVEYGYDPLDGLGGITFAVDWDSRDCQDSASSNCPGSCRGVGFEMAEYRHGDGGGKKTILMKAFGTKW